MYVYLLYTKHHGPSVIGVHLLLLLAAHGTQNTLPVQLASVSCRTQCLCLKMRRSSVKIATKQCMPRSVIRVTGQLLE